MNKYNLIERLKQTVVERTPSHDNFDEKYTYDEKLMKTHYLIAKLYLQERNIVQARIYLGNAERQLVYFNKTLQKKIKPIDMEEEKKSKCPPYDLEIILEKARKRKKNEDKFDRWSKKIFNLGDMLQ
jgi:hypothetical protein